MGDALRYWVIGPDVPGAVGPLDRDGYFGALGASLVMVPLNLLCVGWCETCPASGSGQHAEQFGGQHVRRPGPNALGVAGALTCSMDTPSVHILGASADGRMAAPG